MSLLEVNCTICHLKDEEIIFETETGNIVRCKKCGLLYRNPRLSEKEEIRKYRDHAYDDSYCANVNASKKQMFISVLKKIEGCKGKLLDVGCADGYFLQLAKEKGWEPYGVEISNYFSRKARRRIGHDHIFDLPLKMTEFPSDFFDVVTLRDVPDHLGDPWGELKEIQRILKTKGLLIIRVRNIFFHILINKLFKKSVIGILKKPAVFHLNGFHQQTLKALLDQAGFSKIRIGNSKLTRGDPYSQAELLGSWMTDFCKRIFYFLSESTSIISGKNILISPSLIAYAEKN